MSRPENNPQQKQCRIDAVQASSDINAQTEQVVDRYGYTPFGTAAKAGATFADAENEAVAGREASHQSGQTAIDRLESLGYSVVQAAHHFSGDRIVRLTDSGMETIAKEGLFVVLADGNDELNYGRSLYQAVREMSS